MKQELKVGKLKCSASFIFQNESHNQFMEGSYFW